MDSKANALVITCDDGSQLDVLEIQPPGKKPMDAKSFWFLLLLLLLLLLRSLSLFPAPFPVGWIPQFIYPAAPSPSSCQRPPLTPTPCVMLQLLAGTVCVGDEWKELGCRGLLVAFLLVPSKRERASETEREGERGREREL